MKIDIGDGYIREISFTPGHNDIDRECKHTPQGDHGIHGMELTFVLAGPAGVVNFGMATNWVPGRVGFEQREHPDTTAHLFPMAWDLGHHYRAKPDDDYHTYFEKCPWTGGECWYDGSSLNADPIMVKFVELGEEYVWEALERYYEELWR